MRDKQRRHRHRDDNDDDQPTDDVTEAGLESFPASDPPAYNTPGRGKSNGSEPNDKPKDEDRPPHDGRRRRGHPRTS